MNLPSVPLRQRSHGFPGEQYDLEKNPEDQDGQKNVGFRFEGYHPGCVFDLEPGGISHGLSYLNLSGHGMIQSLGHADHSIGEMDFVIEDCSHEVDYCSVRSSARCRRGSSHVEVVQEVVLRIIGMRWIVLG